MASRSQLGAAEPAPLSYADVAIVTLGRVALNVAFRMLYPLLPFLSGQLRVTVQTVSWLITVQVLVGLLSPIGGLLADLRGPKAVLTLGNALFCAGALICALAGSFAGFLVGYILIGLTTPFYMPGATAYLSARTPYDRRGRMLGIFELGYAGSAILGVAPLMVMVERTRSTAAVFWVLLGVALLAAPLIRHLPPVGPVTQTRGRRLDWSSLRLPRVLALLGLCTLVLCSLDLIFVVHGLWLKAGFGATEAQLGGLALLLGVAELVAGLGSALLVDQIGKKRSVVTGFALTAMCAVGLAFGGGSWLLVSALLVLFTTCFEFAFVSTIPLASGLAPAARATVLAMMYAATSTGRAIGSQIGYPLWSSYGIRGTGLLAAALIGLGVMLCMLFVHETERDEV